MNDRYSFYPRESNAFSLSYYANVSEIFITPQDTPNYVFEAWVQNRLFGCLIC